MEAIKLIAISTISVLLVSCTSEHAVLKNDAGQTVVCAHEGWGWLGAPVAAAQQSSCLKKAKEAGFKDGAVPGAVVSPSVVSTGVNASAKSRNLNIAFPAGWAVQSLSESQRAEGDALVAYNKTTDSWALVSAVSLEGLTDRDAYVLSRRANQESRVKDATHSEITLVDVNGRAARRFEVTGMAPDGRRVTFLYTVIFGQSDVVVVNAWTPAPSFDGQKSTFEGFAERLAGIQ